MFDLLIKSLWLGRVDRKAGRPVSYRIARKRKKNHEGRRSEQTRWWGQEYLTLDHSEGVTMWTCMDQRETGQDQIRKS